MKNILLVKPTHQELWIGRKLFCYEVQIFSVPHRHLIEQLLMWMKVYIFLHSSIITAGNLKILPSRTIAIVCHYFVMLYYLLQLPIGSQCIAMKELLFLLHLPCKTWWCAIARCEPCIVMYLLHHEYILRYSRRETWPEVWYDLHCIFNTMNTGDVTAVSWCYK